MRTTASRSLVLAAWVCSGCAGTPEKPAEPPPAAPPAGGPRPGGGALRHLEEAKKLARGEKVEEAIAASRRAIEADPQLEEAYLLLHSLCSLGARADCAEEALDKGLAALPTSPALHHARGMWLLESEKVDPAIAALEKAVELHGGSRRADLLADLAYAYVFGAKLEQADQLTNEARQLDPKSFSAAFTHGEALLRLKRFADAVAAYQAASEISPGDELAKSRLAVAHFSLANLKLQEKQPAAAKEQVEKAIAIAGEQGPLLELLAKAQEAAGDKSGAKATRAKLKALGKGK